MYILFDILHPAHVHLFRHFIDHLTQNGHTVTIASRGNKDVTCDLLNYYGLEHIPISRVRTGSLNLAAEALQRDLKITALHLKNKFDLAFGTSFSIAHLSAVSKMRSFIVEEDDDDVVPLFAKITYPFATGIIVPDCLNFSRWKQKRIIHSSYHELAYLHPDHFTPDPNVLQKYDLNPKDYVVVRKSALTAHHDFGIQGLEKRIWNEILDALKNEQIVLSFEGSRNFNIKPWDMHHVLGFAKALISDSQTMTAEAAVLGVPSIRCNSFVGRIEYLEELEHRYGLTKGFLPGDKKIMQELKAILNNLNIHQTLEEKRRIMLLDKHNLTSWLIQYFETHLKH